VNEKAVDGNGGSNAPDGSNSPFGSTMVDGAKLRAAVRGAAGREPAGVANTGVANAGDDATEATFDPSRTSHVGQYALRRLYHESDRDALVVLYSAEGCGPCGRLRPIIARVVDEYVDRVHFVEIDVDRDGDVAESAGVLGTPCVHVFREKERVAVISGVKMRSKYRDAIDSCLRLEEA
jgi:thioredoxin reductase (NADPH)